MLINRRSLVTSSAVGAALALSRCKSRRPAPATLWPIPEWTLTDQDNAPFGSAQLRGKVYVANFIFTRCPSSCPRLTRKMAALAARLRSSGDRVRFVSISVDPEYDTPAKLKEFGDRYHADWSRWRFVTGPFDRVLRAIDQGFRVSSGMSSPGSTSSNEFDPYALAHSNHFALVDGRSNMRGAYSVEEASGVERLALDVEALLAEG
jgi:protein SCO1/2